VWGDFNLPNVERGVQEDRSTLLPMGIMTDLESDLIEGMLCCDLGQINSIPNQNGKFLDLIFSNAGTDITVEICKSPLHHWAYELLLDVRLCKLEAAIMDERRFIFGAADCKVITDLVWLTGMVFSRIRELTCALTFFMMLCGLVLENLGRDPRRVVPRNFLG
jgi:hypothetical protein